MDFLPMTQPFGLQKIEYCEQGICSPKGCVTGSKDVHGITFHPPWRVGQRTTQKSRRVDVTYLSFLSDPLWPFSGVSSKAKTTADIAVVNCDFFRSHPAHQIDSCISTFLIVVAFNNATIYTPKMEHYANYSEYSKPDLCNPGRAGDAGPGPGSAL
jgi:hypothetical protein